MSDLNPQIVEISVGVRELRTVTIYPLSMADQFKMTSAIVEGFSKFAVFDQQDIKDEDVVAQMVEIIENNIDQILTLVLADDEQVTMTELTNEQFSDLAITVFEVNYEGAAKKFQTLVGKVKSLMPGPKRVEGPENQ